jgi:hypothetical protein
LAVDWHRRCRKRLRDLVAMRRGELNAKKKKARRLRRHWVHGGVVQGCRDGQGNEMVEAMLWSLAR